MRSLGMLQIAGGVVAAGVVAAGASALTGSGVVWGGSNGGTATQFVGGTVTQSVTGASVTDVAYTADVTGTQTTAIAITVAGAGGKYLAVTPGGGAFSTGGVVADEWKCTGGQVTPIYDATAPKVQLAAGASTVITCVPSDSTSTHATAGRYYAGLSSLQLAITNS